MRRLHALVAVVLVLAATAFLTTGFWPALTVASVAAVLLAHDARRGVAR